MDAVLQEVQRRMKALGLGLRDTAAQIGVTSASLERHLAGAYVRSDSLAKYRGWLRGRSAPVVASPGLFPPSVDEARPVAVEFPCPPWTRDRPYNVVDLFSGCGGMSLGFDLLGDPREAPVFHTVLALDVVENVVALHNQNHVARGPLQGTPARWVDIADFVNAAEMLAFYLDHLAARGDDLGLRHGLGLAEFKGQVRAADAGFLTALGRIRSGAGFKREYERLDATIFGQTSVIGFHEALGLPATTASRPRLGPLVWADHDGTASLPGLPSSAPAAHDRLMAVWDAEVGRLKARTAGSGRGQLASSAGRIGRFLQFLDTGPMREVRTAWLSWRCQRDGLRQARFTDPAVETALQALYTGDRRVHVLLGGPPCQGFSRIGRGKIRSLREDQVHVESDPEAGDTRNLLLLKYVEFISALGPDLFLFENVRHFQASVQAPEGTFRATEVLNEAIQELSQHRLDYHVTDRIVDCSRHLIPQTRERFVMAGVRSDLEVPGIDPGQLPGWCLDLPVHPAIPLRDALAGLPVPVAARGQRSGSGTGMASLVALAPERDGDPGPSAAYRAWIRQPAPGAMQGGDILQVDAHCIREPRPDDQAFFALLGPGTRWMDYRCDESATLQELRRLLEQLLQSPAAVPGIDRQTVDRLFSRLDGSLSIRLLLEAITPLHGELHHHLLTPNYLAKREGNNGDWIARLHPDRPAKTMVSHMAKDTYAYVHPSEARTLSVREAARVQTFPDWYRFGAVGLVDGFRAVGNAVPPLLGHHFAGRVGRLLGACVGVR